jgi:hypothetical protein
MPSNERFWPSRLRWRLRGATQWPAFALATALDTFIVHELPPITSDLHADSSLDLFPAFLIAAFGNLFIVAAVAPLLARGLVRRRAAAAPAGVDPAAFAPDREVLRDRVATGLLVAGIFATLIAGLANRPTIVQATDALEDNGREVRLFVERSGDAELRRNLETADTIRLSAGFFRTCIARDDRRRRVCILVDTKRDPIHVKRDPSGEPNSVYNR